MSRPHWRRLCCVALATTLALWPLAAPSALSQEIRTPIAEDNPARIWVEDGALHYFGAMSSASIKAFTELTAGLDVSTIDRFVVNSAGGDTTAGRVLGRWIREHRLDVDVVASCFSSCANYVFPAGAGKRIGRHAFVGWHGSETEYEIIALGMPDKTARDLEAEALEAALKPVMPEATTPEQMDAAVDRQIAIAEASRADERAFFSELGLDREYTVHGLRPANIDSFRASGKAGWTYKLDDMARLGLGKVEFLGPGPYETSGAVTRNLLVIPFNPALVPK